MAEEVLQFQGKLGFEYCIESYGVAVKIQSNREDLLFESKAVLRDALVGRLKFIESIDTEHSFGLAAGENGTYFLFRDGEQMAYADTKFKFLKFFDSVLRLVIAEHAPGLVFVHSGVVAWNGRAVLLPADSFQGKTTLVAELVKNGAVYYSDEYAVLDESGLVHPFPRKLSIRYFDGHTRERDVTVESLGGSIGSEPIPVGFVLLTEFVADTVWDPEMLTVGNGVIEVVRHTIPVRFNTEFSLKVLNKALSRAIIAKGPRGEAHHFAKALIGFFDKFTSSVK